MNRSRSSAVKPGFNRHEKNGVPASEPITKQSLAGKWKIIHCYPQDLTFVCPTEIVGFAAAFRGGLVAAARTDRRE